MTQAETKQEVIRQDKTRNRDEMRSIETVEKDIENQIKVKRWKYTV